MLCPICYDDIHDENAAAGCDVCGALYHYDCIATWFKRGKHTCPTCRSNHTMDICDVPVDFDGIYFTKAYIAHHGSIIMRYYDALTFIFEYIDK